MHEGKNNKVEFIKIGTKNVTEENKQIKNKLNS